MNVRTFRAPSMAEALTLVKRHLGGDAVILHTRSTRIGGILGWRARAVVEITATDPATVRPRRQAAHPAPASRAPAAFAGLAAPAAAAVDAYRRRSPDQIALPVAAPAQPAPPRQPADDGVVMQVRPRRGSGDSAPTVADRCFEPTSGPRVPADANSALYRELADIKLLVNQVLNTAPPGAIAPGSGAMPEALFRHYLRLLESQVSRDIADSVLASVRGELNAAELADEQIVRTAVLRHVGALIPVADDLPVPKPAEPGGRVGGRPHTVALVGPTGVGKTTTVAKLAAAYKLRQGRSVALITSDTYRIAAVEQLRTYASIIGLPLKVVLTPSEMSAAVESLRNHDVILIDTAGRSQHAADRLIELEQFLDAAKPHETHLVLSTASDEDVLVRAAESFARVRPNRVLLTKLDEAVNFGVVANVMRRLAKAGLPLSFVTTGQEVPDHIEPGRADRLARMILDNRLGPEASGLRVGELIAGVGGGT